MCWQWDQIEENYRKPKRDDQSRQCTKKQNHPFADKGPYSQSYGFSSGHVQMWVLDHKEGWALKNWWFWTVVLEKTLESPLNSRDWGQEEKGVTENEMVDGITDSIDMSLCELMGSQRVSHDLVTEQHHHQKRDDIGLEWEGSCGEEMIWT